MKGFDSKTTQSDKLSRRTFVGATLAAAALGLVGTGLARASEKSAAADSAKAAAGPDASGQQAPKAIVRAAASTHETPTYPVTITDRVGREVVIEKADSIVTLCATGYDRMLIIGEADRVVGNFGKLSSWASFVNGGAEVNSLGGGPAAADPDVEALNALNTDVLYCWQEAIDAGSVTDPGKAAFAAVCAQLSTGNPTTVEEFVDYLDSEVYLYSDAVANDVATERANAWVDYVNEKLSYITEKTSELTPDQLVPVYCARGGSEGSDPFNGFLKHSYPDFCIQLAGGVNVADEADAESYGDVTAEQIAVWNPQVVFCGRIADPAAITGDATFAGTDAVANGKVYLTPSGVMEWDTGSECVLNALYMAKTLHPDLFDDLDMAKEVKDYYARFYDVELTDQQAENILTRKGPQD